VATINTDHTFSICPTHSPEVSSFETSYFPTIAENIKKKIFHATATHRNFVTFYNGFEALARRFKFTHYVLPDTIEMLKEPVAPDLMEVLHRTTENTAFQKAPEFPESPESLTGLQLYQALIMQYRHQATIYQQRFESYSKIQAWINTEVDSQHLKAVPAADQDDVRKTVVWL
jgi:hypothetical protein